MTTSVQVGLRPAFAVIPLLSSSLTVFYALVEPTIFVAWIRSANTETTATNRAFRIWWNLFAASSLATILSVTVPSVAAGAYALAKLPSQSREWKLYAAGTAFALGHFAFASVIYDAIKHMASEEVEKTNGNIEWLKKWLRIHAWRTVLTDIPSAVCFGWLVFRA